jgi:hypothetical protein
MPTLLRRDSRVRKIFLYTIIRLRYAGRMKKKGGGPAPSSPVKPKPKGPKPISVGALAWPSKTDKYDGFDENVTRVHAPRR